MSKAKPRSDRWRQRNAAVDRLIKKAGGPTAVANELGLTQGAVSQWREVPPLHALKVAALARVPVSEVRKDMIASASMARKVSAANGRVQAPEKMKS